MELNTSSTEIRMRIQLSKMEGGIRTVLASVDVTIAAGDTFQLEITDAAKKIIGLAKGSRAA